MNDPKRRETVTNIENERPKVSRSGFNFFVFTEIDEKFLNQRTLSKQKTPFVFPSGVEGEDGKEVGPKIEVRPLRFARSVAPLCGCELDRSK